MCTVLLPPGNNPIAVNKYIISYQRTDIGKYSFVNKTIQLWNRLLAEILGALPCKPNTFRKRVRKVINVVNWKKCLLKLSKSVVKWSKMKWSEVNEVKLSEGYYSVGEGVVNRGVPWRVLMGGEVKWSEVKWSEVKWSEGHVKIGVQYLWSNNIRNQMQYCIPLALLFICALLLTVVGLLCIGLLILSVFFYFMCIVWLCVYSCLTYFSWRIAG